MVKWLVALAACSLLSGSVVAQPRASTGSAGPASAFSQHHITRDNNTHVYMVVANTPAAERELKSGERIHILG